MSGHLIKASVDAGRTLTSVVLRHSGRREEDGDELAPGHMNEAVFEVGRDAKGVSEK